jgi:dipeptidyl aminopeptidase/acylaminoacyl peptidase
MRPFVTQRRSRLAFIILSVMLMLAACGEPDPMFSTPLAQTGAEPVGKILFVADGDIHQWDGRVTRITSDEHAKSPTWAPAGDRFAYVRMFEGYSELVVADSSGRLLLQVTEHEPNDIPHTEEFAFNAAWAFDPVWSPAGEQLIFVSDKGGLDPFSDPLFLWYVEDWDIPPYALPASTAFGLLQENPTLSPDGDVAAFVTRVEVSNTARTTEIWTLNLNTGAAEALVSHPEGAYDPNWSHDGQNIAYVQRTEGRNDVWIKPVDGGESYRLTDVGTVVSPVWSPDDRFIAFFRIRDGQFEAAYVELSREGDGRVQASEPRRLFTATNIDAPSGMTWVAR